MDSRVFLLWAVVAWGGSLAAEPPASWLRNGGFDSLAHWTTLGEWDVAAGPDGLQAARIRGMGHCLQDLPAPPVGTKVTLSAACQLEQVFSAQPLGCTFVDLYQYDLDQKMTASPGPCCGFRSRRDRSRCFRTAGVGNLVLMWESSWTAAGAPGNG
jgi:hypothetical protein